MARTTINSQGVPVGTITASDLSYPLADFSSTGIDDNASSNAITISSGQAVTMSGLSYPTSDGSANQVLTTDGSGALTFADTSSGGVEYVAKTTTYTASANEGIIANTSGGAWTLTLPASPSTGDKVFVADGGDWSTNNLTVARNGSTIEGSAADFIMNYGGVNVGFIYDGSTWQVYPQAGLLQLMGIDDNATSTALTITGARNVGIGTTSPSTVLDIEGAWVNNQGLLALNATSGVYSGLTMQHSGTAKGYLYYDNASQFLDLYSTNDLRLIGGGSERARITSGGKLLLNETTFNSGYSSFANMQISDPTAPGLVINTTTAGASNYGRLAFTVGNSTGNEGLIRYNSNDYHMSFWTNASERMRIDSSGNVGIGTASPSAKLHIDTSGTGLKCTGPAVFGADSHTKLTTYSDSTYVGIYNGSSLTSDEAIYMGGDHTYFYVSGSEALRLTNVILYTRHLRVLADNTYDIGTASGRYNDAHITNGVTTGSDERLKQDISSLSEAETRVAVACKGLLRKWRWKDAVEEKGENARIHFGIIAQDLKAAFEAEGLDAGRYGMFMHDTWTDEETDEEHDRMGIRYSELLAFIIAAI